eukprot:jgi/Mesen1/915/ME000117S00076
MSAERPKELLLDEKWDQCIDLTLRRVVYSSLSGVVGGLLLLRIGSAYTDCSHIFDGKMPKWPVASQPSSQAESPPPQD